MTQLVIIRHGEYIFKPDEKPYDMGLTERGIKQAEKLRERLATGREFEAEVLISSPLARALQTAEIIAPTLKLPVIVDPDLEEWSNFDGSAENEEFLSKLREMPPAQLAYMAPYPGALSYSQFAVRVCFALNRIAQEHAGKTVLIVAHGGIMEASFIYAYGLNPLAPGPVMLNLDPYYTAITHWVRKTTKPGALWRLMTYNDYSHLRDF